MRWQYQPAIWTAYTEGRLTVAALWPNFLSGVVVAIVAVPLALGFAIASGAKPEQGLFTAVVSALVVSLCGGSRLQIAGPTGAFVAVLAGVTAQYGISGLMLATMMAGVMLVALGLLRAGDVIRYIPAPVILGFTSGIAVIIWVGQWRYFFGLPAVPVGPFYSQWWFLIKSLSEFHSPTLCLGLIGIGLSILLPRLPIVKSIPAPLLVLLALTGVAQLDWFSQVATVGSLFGDLPNHLPVPQLPDLKIETLIILVGPAITIAMLGAIESLLSAVIADGMSGARHDPDSELIGQGLANILAPCFGGFAATGAIARTATNVRAGATSPVSGVFHSLVLILLMWWLAPWARLIPMAALAAVLFMVAFNMAHMDELVRTIVRAPRADGAIAVVTFVLTIFTDIVVAVNIGVLLAALHFLRRMAHSVSVLPDESLELNAALEAKQLASLPKQCLVFTVRGPIFFAAAAEFQAALKHTHSEPKLILLRIDHVPFVDWSGIAALEQLLAEFANRNIDVWLIGANLRVERKLSQARLNDRFVKLRFYPTLSAALAEIPTHP